ncbi:MraY family glycosyltransferase [Fluviicola taffensis]|uniref:Glycosyl transferase, family 4, conserved region-containing protein n=1 Tax=Fluviicola taffensis (strain DSM 16823 / NCIMB 13979 / RW262) TaxID=755732 RepID=F2IKD4_FLUTR|nr:MraY family glycosyltransferase [Fluviicola taffensis]AEA44037.1 Glycosyl transferase, family 4, conserved region-containing protein [Fluviicola taffensis DSM 16823]
MSYELILACLGFLLFGIIMSYVSNGILLRFSQSLGIRNKNDVTVRWSNESKPSLGGIGFFVAFIFGTVAYSIIFNSENIFQNRQFVGLLTAGTLSFIMGLADDAYNTKPFMKLFVQILCGIILVLSHTIIELTAIPWINALITITWVVGIMNSLNMLDNMDGISGTTSLFILLSCLGTNIILFDWNMNIWTLTILIQIGAIIGFLIYNLHPSRLFMGDAGSQFIGLFVAFFSVHELWNVGKTVQLNPLVGGAITLIAFTPAIADTLTVVINRLKKGKNPMVGGKDHTTHHLVYSGLNDKQVWIVFLGIGFMATLVTLLSVIFAKMGNLWMALFLTSYFFAVFLVLYRNTLIHKK